MDAPKSPCSARNTIMLSMFHASPHSRLVSGETGGGCSEQPPRRENPRQPAGKRNHDDFGNQIRRLHPTDLILRGGQSPADVLQRRGNDLDVQQRHEHADAHDHEWENVRIRNGGGKTVAFISRSFHSLLPSLKARDATGRAPPFHHPRIIRTATRCTILVKLPVAFSGRQHAELRAGRRRDADDVSVKLFCRESNPLRRSPAHPGDIARAGFP